MVLDAGSKAIKDANTVLSGKNPNAPQEDPNNAIQVTSISNDMRAHTHTHVLQMAGKGVSDTIDETRKGTIALRTAGGVLENGGAATKKTGAFINKQGRNIKNFATKNAEKLGNALSTGTAKAGDVTRLGGASLYQTGKKIEGAGKATKELATAADDTLKMASRYTGGVAG